MNTRERSLIKSQTRVLDIYRTLSPFYAPIRPIWAQTFNRDAERYLDRVALPAVIHPAARVLDLGCGPGINRARLRRLNLPHAGYVGIDFSSAMLGRAVRGKINDRMYTRSDANHLPFRAESFEVVISTWMFSHLTDPANVVREAFRLLTPGGWMIVGCYTRGTGVFRSLQHPIESLFWMRCIPQDEILTWPGLVEVKTFANGWNAVVSMRKEG